MLLVLPEQLTLSYMHSLILGLYISYLDVLHKLRPVTILFGYTWKKIEFSKTLTHFLFLFSPLDLIKKDVHTIFINVHCPANENIFYYHDNYL